MRHSNSGITGPVSCYANAGVQLLLLLEPLYDILTQEKALRGLQPVPEEFLKLMEQSRDKSCGLYNLIHKVLSP